MGISDARFQARIADTEGESGVGSGGGVAVAVTVRVAGSPAVVEPGVGDAVAPGVAVDSSCESRKQPPDPIERRIARNVRRLTMVPIGSVDLSRSIKECSLSTRGRAQVGSGL